VAYRFFTPSPRGYVELFVALPLIAAGLLTIGAGLIADSRSWFSRAAGWLLVGATCAVLGTFLFVLVFQGR
jgi:hypothetical protein